MPEEEIPLLERVASYYQQLTSVAADLNAVSDELGKSITEIDAALKKLNLGITTWVTIQGDDDEDFSATYWSRDIGYSKVSGKWGISLRTIEGDHNHHQETIEEWLFNDAPRSIRLEAIDKIPALLEKLSQEAVSTTKKIRARLNDAQAVAKVVTGIPSISIMRHAIGSALVKAGHISAAQLLGASAWWVDGTNLRIVVPGVNKNMLALNVGTAVEKLIRQELQRLDATTRLLIVPGETLEKTSTEVK